MILNNEYVDRLTDEELCMIEQLTYLDEMVAEKAGINNVFSKVSVDDINSPIIELTERLQPVSSNMRKSPKNSLIYELDFKCFLVISSGFQ